MHHGNIAFLIADGGHGRIVTWDPDTNAYRTRVQIVDGISPPPRYRPRAAARVHFHDRRETLRRQVRGPFVHVLALHLRLFAREHKTEGVIIAAPARLIGPLRAELKTGPRLLAVLAKDLTKHDDEHLHKALLDTEIQVSAG